MNYGINGHYFQGGVYCTNLPQQVADMQAMGVQSMRIDVTSAADAAVLASTVIPGLAPITVQPVINFWTPGATEADCYTSAYNEAKNAAPSLKGLLLVELLNEPDVGFVNNGTPNTGDGRLSTDWNQPYFLRVRGLLRGAIDGLRAGGYTGQIAGPSIGWLHTGLSDMLWNGTQPDGTSGYATVRWDVTNWHWYYDMGDIESAHSVNVLSYLKTAYGRPIILSEVGVQYDTPEATINSYIGSQVAKFGAYGQKYGVIGWNWYELYNFVPNGTFYMGLYSGLGVKNAGRADAMTSAIKLASQMTPAASTEIFQQTLSSSITRTVEINTSGVRILDSDISNTIATAIVAEGANDITGTEVLFSSVKTPNFGVLLNTTGYTGGAKFRTLGCDIQSINADAVELNTPGNPFEGTITNGNFLAVKGQSGGGSAGFCVGIAAARYNAVTGNVMLGSLFEIVHVEDSQRGTVITGNTGYGLKDGVRIYEAKALDSYPVSVVGNSFESRAATPTYTGIQLFWSSQGSQSGCSLVGNVLSNYAEGIHIGAPATGNVNVITHALANSLVGCTTGITAWGSSNLGTVRQFGTNYADKLTTLFSTKHNSARFGKVVVGKHPTAIIANTYSAGYGGALPSSCDGFEFPLTSAISVTPTTGSQALFALVGPAQGRIKVQAKSNYPTTDWCHISADLNFDGTALTLSNVLSRVHGNVATVDLALVNGSLRIVATSAAGTTASLAYGWIEFDGEYWDA